MTTQPTEKEADFRIDFNGRWFHGGAEIKRHELARLFATKGLRTDGQGVYWLQSPEEHYPVTVEDVPFIVVDYDIHNAGKDQSIDLKTNMDHVVTLGPDKVLELRRGIPYIQVKNGLYARFSRSVFYNLVREAEGEMVLTLRSSGMDHILGRI